MRGRLGVCAAAVAHAAQEERSALHLPCPALRAPHPTLPRRLSAHSTLRLPSSPTSPSHSPPLRARSDDAFSPEQEGERDTVSELGPAVRSSTTLGRLLCPLRVPSVLDRWSPIEVARFEGALCLYGKNFALVQRAVQTKTHKEIVEFFYDWKQSAHYKVWKRDYVPLRIGLHQY